MAEALEDIDLDAEWQTQWKRASEEFASLANGKQLTNNSFPITPEEITQRLQQKGQRDGHAQEWEKFAVKTGKLVLKLANAGTSIAAMFFGPAQQCMNAINFLADIVESYNKIFENLATLFDKIADALERFELYRRAQNVLAKHIKNRANQILLRLVNVCGLAHRLLEGSMGRKFKNFVQNAFSKEDQGVAAEMKALEDLAQRELANNVIESMIQTSTTAVITKEILETQRKAEAALENERQILWLEGCVSKENQHEAWRRHMATASSISDSGTWMTSLEAFQTWIKSTRTSHRVLLLNGVVGSGKTTLLTRMVTMIPEVFNRTTNNFTNSVCAYHYLELDESLDSALRAMSIQLARADLIYRKNLYENLRSHGETETLPTSINSLFELLFMVSSTNVPIFLLLDDIHVMNDLRTLLNLLDFLNSKRARNPAVKLLLSSRSNEANDNQLSMHIQCQVDIGRENKDILKFSQLEIEKLPFLQGPSITKLDLRKEILDTLSQEQSFSGVILVLNEIRGTTLPTTIRKVLADAKAKTSIEGGIKRMIKRASALPEEDVRDLCALLEWVMCLNVSAYRFKARQSLVHVSSLSFLLQSRYSDQSLKPLEDRLNDEFRGFFNINGGFEVSLAFKGIEEYFEESTANQDQGDTQTEMLTMRAEIEIVRRLLKNMCDQEMYSRLGFDAFFDGKLQEPVKIYVDTDKMFAKVVLDMLKLCIPAPLEDMAWQHVSIIESEAIYWWLVLLGQADLSLLDQNLKYRLGKALVPMLCNDADILRWQWSVFSSQWVFANVDVADMLVAWLQDSAIRNFVTREQKAWIQQVLVSPQTSNREVLLPILRIKSRQWLYPEQLDQAVSDYGFAPFRCIRAFLDRIEQDQDVIKNPKKLDADYFPTISAEGIQSAAVWVKQVLGIEHWSRTALCLLADTFQFFNCYEEATHYYKAAQELDTDFVSAMLSEARSTFKIGRKDEAVKLLRSGISKLEIQDPLPLELLIANRLLLAKWQRSLNQWEEAINTVNLNLTNTPNHVDSIYCKLEIYAERGNQQDCYKIFEDLTAWPWESTESESRDKDEQAEENTSESGTSSTPPIDHDAEVSSELDYDEDSDHRIPDGLDMFLNLLLIQNSDELLTASADGGKFHKTIEIAKEVDYHEIVEVRLASLSKIQNALGRFFEGEPPKDPDDAYNARVNLVLSRCCLAVYWTGLLYRVSFDEKNQNKAIEECEQAIYAWNSMNEIVRANRIGIERRIVEWLSSLYLEMAKLQPFDTEDEFFWIRKVKKLWTVQCTYGDKKSNQWTESFLLAAYHSSRKHSRKARGYLQSWVKQGFHLLDDEDPSNNNRGYDILSSALVLDNKPNALAAFSLAHRTWAVTHSGISASPENSADTEITTDKSLFGECNGGCGHEHYPSLDMYICKICVDVYLDIDCYTKVLNGKHLPWFCNPNHEFLHVPPWNPTKSVEIGEGMVEVGDEVISIQDWKNGLRKTWDIPA